MMDDKVLLAALLKLHARTPLPASQLTAAQRRELDRFARQTGAVSCQRQGRGDCYLVANPALFSTHLNSLSPGLTMAADNPIPQRAQHIADTRNSKAGAHRHPHYYLLLKAVGEDVLWREAKRGIELPLGLATRHFGAATLAIDANDAWSGNNDLWLVENQALFDQTDWLPINTSATIAYYGGQLNGILLNWLASRRRAGRVIHFPDYDGVGLANFSRLQALLGDACLFWLMPDWEQKLDRYGSTQLWRDTLRDFNHARPLLPDYLAPLAAQMGQSGRALEQEAVWLPAT
jgi:hypothetical protein